MEGVAGPGRGALRPSAEAPGGRPDRPPDSTRHRPRVSREITGKQVIQCSRRMPHEDCDWELLVAVGQSGLELRGFVDRGEGRGPSA